MRQLQVSIWLTALTITSMPLLAQGRQTEEAFRWSGSISSGETLYLRNLNGGIEVERASGAEVEIVAEKRWRRGDPDAVEVVTVRHGGTMTVCALWDADDNECGEEGEYRHRDVDRDASRVSVHFTVRLPDGLALDASTVNGALRVEEVGGPVRARSTNGAIHVSTTSGPVSARTTNGSVDVQAASGEVDARTTNGDVTVSLDEEPQEDLHFRTTNGSITIELPADLDAELDASVTNGSIDTEFEVRLRGRINRRRLRATIGDGGPTIELRTTNGSIAIRQRS